MMVRPALTMRGSTNPFFTIHGIRNCETPVGRGEDGGQLDSFGGLHGIHEAEQLTVSPDVLVDL